ncbi:tyrosine-type recombinase/integrase, partial [Lonsdalea quercina]|uniref:tyrosine-type recombinase/integrase n=1 Tax=Lonsdalea quercina TaxID=71657 RepID=UPI0039749BA1
AGHHGIGGSAGLLPSTSSKEGKALRERLAGLGVLRATTRQDHFRGCVVMPVMGWSESANVAQRGRVLQLYGRRTTADYAVKKGAAKHLYLPSPLVGVWNEEALKASSEVILCEALIDAMTFWCAGFRNVTTAYGANGADLRWIQAMLGHRSVESTQIYTQVSIRALQTVHASTHPAEQDMEEETGLLADLTADEEEDETPVPPDSDNG